MNMIRQGDVLLVRADNVDISNAKREPIDEKIGRVVLAYGEATGHHHSLSADTATVYEFDGKRLLSVEEDTTLTHQEHDAIEIEKGTYWVVPQFEYSPQEIQRVID